MFIDSIVESMSSDFFANIISLFEFICTLLALLIGVEKVSELLREHNKMKRQAIFSYHINLKIYIRRIKKLLSDSQNYPLKTLYFFSPIDDIRSEGQGYERLVEDLYDLSKDFLSYLSSKSDQIPAAESNKIKQWNGLIETLVDYLTDFTLYKSGAYIPTLRNHEGIKLYHDNVLKNLNDIINMIQELEKEYIDDLNNE